MITPPQRCEEKIDYLVHCLQPSQDSEDKRTRIITIIKGVIKHHFDMDVHLFGSVAFKTYLPDGDIDLTISAPPDRDVQNYLREVSVALQTNPVTGKQCHIENLIMAEVPVLKVVYGGIYVDISANQTGGLDTLGFLTEVDNFIGNDHLFKRSLLLVKAWCYYESRIMSAGGGLLGTYALTVMLLCIFNLHTHLTTPLEALYHFLKYYSSFNFEDEIVGVYGPIRIARGRTAHASDPVEVPEKLSYRIPRSLMRRWRAEFSGTVPATPSKPVNPDEGRQDAESRPASELQGDASGDDSDPSDDEYCWHPSFTVKYFNVRDPLRPFNNVGRSVNQTNYYRIRRAIRKGYKDFDDFFTAIRKMEDAAKCRNSAETQTACNAQTQTSPRPPSDDTDRVETLMRSDLPVEASLDSISDDSSESSASGSSPWAAQDGMEPQELEYPNFIQCFFKKALEACQRARATLEHDLTNDNPLCADPVLSAYARFGFPMPPSPYHLPLLQLFGESAMLHQTPSSASPPSVTLQNSLFSRIQESESASQQKTGQGSAPGNKQAGRPGPNGAVPFPPPPSYFNLAASFPYVHYHSHLYHHLLLHHYSQLPFQHHYHHHHLNLWQQLQLQQQQQQQQQQAQQSPPAQQTQSAQGATTPLPQHAPSTSLPPPKRGGFSAKPAAARKRPGTSVLPTHSSGVFNNPMLHPNHQTLQAAMQQLQREGKLAPMPASPPPGIPPAPMHLHSLPTPGQTGLRPAAKLPPSATTKGTRQQPVFMK